MASAKTGRPNNVQNNWQQIETKYWIEATNQCSVKTAFGVRLKEMNGYVSDFPLRKCNKNQLLNRKSKMNSISMSNKDRMWTKLKFTLFHTPFKWIGECVRVWVVVRAFMCVFAYEREKRAYCSDIQRWRDRKSAYNTQTRIIPIATHTHTHSVWSRLKRRATKREKKASGKPFRLMQNAYKQHKNVYHIGDNSNRRNRIEHTHSVCVECSVFSPISQWPNWITAPYLVPCIRERESGSCCLLPLRLPFPNIYICSHIFHV